LKNKINKIQKPNGEFDKKYFSLGYPFILGIDEAGRGALAGPVVSCGFLAAKKDLEFLKKLEVNDSKLISIDNRLIIYNELIKSGMKFYISIIDNKIIDKINILQATLQSFQEISEFFLNFKCFILADGNKFFQNCPIPYETVIKGDSKSLVIAAASIIAKVTRDNLMSHEMNDLYPEYNFIKHKGYATLEHRENILKYGISKIHRLSFLKNMNLQNDNILFDIKDKQGELFNEKI
jgi:ribonuclease HII